MYINLDIAAKYEITFDDIINLVLIKQQRYENIGNILEERLLPKVIQEYLDKEWVIGIRGKDNDSEIAKLRITPLGRELLENINTAEVVEDDIKLRDWLVQIYGKEDKIIGNKKRIAQGIAQFRVQSSITKNCLAFLLKTFIGDEKNFQYSQKLENLFFDSSSVFDRSFKLDRCRLWEYYERRQKFFDEKFKKYETDTK